MSVVALLLIPLGLICLSIFVLLFGESPRLRNGIVGKTHRLLTTTLPWFFSTTFRRVLGERTLKRIGSCWLWMCESRNPLLQILFMLLTSVSIGSFMLYAWPHVPNMYLTRVHVYLIPAQITWLYVSYYIACAADPGTITAANVNQHLALYPHDGLIYLPKDCSTCSLAKPARSKHCSMCKSCIARLDHHCAWLNKCVGYNNHRYFFLFLCTLTQFCAYGAYLCVQIYHAFIYDWGLDRAYITDRVDGEYKKMSYRQCMVYILHRDRIIGSIGILAFVISIVVFIFTAYQFYLAGRGITTNEAFKWEMLQDAIDRGELWVTEDDPRDELDAAATASSSLSSTGTKKPRQRSGKSKTAPAGRRRQVMSFAEIDNIYDHGFISNIAEVLFPKPLPIVD
ncbi:DHHC palmitoyltransferase-domain-containing protein [Gongronella butleri]|nr:DHHC palmitoyltransferase-domain-containing protein [Gongronella butleri]